LKLPDLTQNRPDPLLLPDACNNLFLFAKVYWASQVVYSIFFLVWNLLVAVVLVSVARTQTIRIRRLGLGPNQFLCLLTKITTPWRISLRVFRCT
jgi:hypothetical protein